MKHLPSLVLLLVLVPSGHTQDKVVEKNGKKPLVYDSDYYPLRLGHQWRYRVTTSDAPVQKVTITVDQEDAYEHKLTEDKKEITETIQRSRLKIVSGSKELTEHVAVLKDGVYRFSGAGKEITPPLRFLKLPLNQDETWTVDSVSENTILKGTFKWEDENVKVPAGMFQAKKVSSSEFQLGGQKMAIEYWFAPRVGMVKQQIRVGNTEVLLELEEFKAK